MVSNGRKGKGKPIPSAEELDEDKERNQLPWIRKYLNLADKLIKRDKPRDKDNDKDKDGDEGRRSRAA
jgi:hypothetical protein